MTVTLNRGFILWAVGVLQPVASGELLYYMEHVFENAGALPSENDLHSYLVEAANVGQLIRIMREPDLFSLTIQGNSYLSRSQRMSRDRERIFLLADAWNGRKLTSREEQTTESGGVSPPLLQRTTLEGTGANECGPSVPRGRTHWPRYSKQLTKTTGSSSSSRDTFINFLSFNDATQVNLARRASGRAIQPDAVNLALMIGLTPRLISQIIVRPDRHYRSFPIKKRTGGAREIHAPRVFLKTIQRFIVDYIFHVLPQHDAVHSFRNDRSILSNAQCHVGKQWVAGIDVENFFGSITERHINSHLSSIGLDAPSARTLAKLATLNGVLPQGAPTSPILSNSVLYNFDELMSAEAEKQSLVYTRYADDITISGSSIDCIRSLIACATLLLNDMYGLVINDKKTRVLSRRSRQVVTGVVVNDVALPPRDLRRRMRAASYNATKVEGVNVEALNMLRGYLGYFQEFPDLVDNKEFTDFRKNLGNIRARF
ncbi:RNA-directed DNA polymerase [Methylorubrum sp. Q1]|uniref:reverse transcriptase domain-containing protein n=1 Tax=Methylorubrum sp. Q1 TaxID=2562453 RepID=UPI001076859B|nr:reverse transcriptase domain-containing protein [Methylorubrum sp. Q1]TFZ54443.1 RNA-directed DNA polymerase [Methylorubrum sp. Q1]